MEELFFYCYFSPLASRLRFYRSGIFNNVPHTHSCDVNNTNLVLDALEAVLHVNELGQGEMSTVG